MIADCTVLLGYVHAGTVRAEFMRSVLNVTTGAGADRRIGGVTESSAGSLIGKARTLLVGKFMRTAFEWLWMVDTDVVFDPLTLAGLAAHADPVYRPVVSGIVRIGRPDGSRFPSMFTAHESEHGWTFEPAVPAGTLTTVDACGAACLLVHRSVFAKIEADDGPRWFLPMVTAAGMIGEDLSFCLRLRAVGCRPVMVTAVQPGHVKPVII